MSERKREREKGPRGAATLPTYFSFDFLRRGVGRILPFSLPPPRAQLNFFFFRRGGSFFFRCALKFRPFVPLYRACGGEREREGRLMDEVIKIYSRIAVEWAKGGWILSGVFKNLNAAPDILSFNCS